MCHKAYFKHVEVLAVCFGPCQEHNSFLDYLGLTQIASDEQILHYDTSLFILFLIGACNL